MTTMTPAGDVSTGMHRWYRTTPGYTLIAHLGTNGARSFHEMPAAAANAVTAANPGRNLIIATWPEATP